MAFKDDYGDYIDPQTDPGSDPNAIPPGYRLNPATGQLEPIPPYQDSTTPGQTPWVPGSSAPSSAPPGMHWSADLANFVPDTPQNLDGGGGGGGGFGGGGSLGSLIAPYVGSAPPATPSGTGFLPPTPEFHAPGYTPPPAFSYDAFKAPTGEAVLNEPGFKFGLDQGLQGLQQSAAARGVLNGGGTLKDVAAWAQNYAGGKYADAYGREANTYGMNRANAADTYARNYQSQFLDPQRFAFEGAQAEFAPKMQGYATQASAAQRAGEFNYGADFAKYQDDFNRYLSQQQLLYNYRAPFLQG